MECSLTFLVNFAIASGKKCEQLSLESNPLVTTHRVVNRSTKHNQKIRKQLKPLS